MHLWTLAGAFLLGAGMTQLGYVLGRYWERKHWQARLRLFNCPNCGASSSAMLVLPRQHPDVTL